MSLNVTLLKQSFAKIKLYPNTFTGSFYNNLFKDYPEVKTLFALTDMKQQKEHLMQALTLVIDNLQRPDVLNKALKRLGARHVNHGTIAEDYPVVGECLLKTLESFFGKDWTPELKQAWTEAYVAIASMMIEGTKEVSSSSSSDIISGNGDRAIQNLTL